VRENEKDMRKGKEIKYKNNRPQLQNKWNSPLKIASVLKAKNACTKRSK
jgi:hypothetical protein